jgi:hypothetical protein
MNLRVKAASFILSGDNIAKQLEILDNASTIGDTIPDEILVWEKFQFDPLEEIITNIDNLEEILNEVWKEAIKSTK